MPKKLTREEFIIKARGVHGDKYDYSKVVYVNATTKVCIICPEHGELWQTPGKHLSGRGCPLCANIKRATAQAKDTHSFTNEANSVHNNQYDYSKAVYINCKTKVCIICSEHGEFWQQPNNHLQGKGCPDCGDIKIGNSLSKFYKAKRPDISHIETPNGSKAVPVGTKGDYALVDEEDYERVMEYNWNLTKAGYVFNNKIGYMHRFIMNCPDDMVVDHRFHNKLDNRKNQLRVCNHQGNTCNSRSLGNFSSKYKGVWWSRGKGRWVAEIIFNFTKYHLGYFTNEVDAAKAYDAAAKKYHKDFARLNFNNTEL